jgi:hypothetical protein
MTDMHWFCRPQIELRMWLKSVQNDLLSMRFQSREKSARHKTNTVESDSECPVLLSVVQKICVRCTTRLFGLVPTILIGCLFLSVCATHLLPFGPTVLPEQCRSGNKCFEKERAAHCGTIGVNDTK